MADHHELKSQEGWRTALEKQATDSHDSDNASASDGAEQVATLNSLVADESLLRAQAAQLDEEAKKLTQENPDNSAVSEQMHQQANLTQSLANDTSQLIAQVRSDPSKKISRRKIDALHVSVNSSIAIAEGEEGAVVSMHGNSAQHKQEVQTLLHEQQAEAHPEKKEPTREPAKKPAHHTTIHQKKSPVHEPKIEQPVHHTPIKEKIQQGLHVVKEAAIKTEHFIVEKAKAAGHFAMGALRKTGEVLSDVGHAIFHPFALMGSAMGMMHGASKLMHALLPFGHPETEMKVMLARPHGSALTSQAMAAVKMLVLPTGIGGMLHHNPEEEVSPNLWSNLTGHLSLPAIS